LAFLFIEELFNFCKLRNGGLGSTQVRWLKEIIAESTLKIMKGLMMREEELLSGKKVE